MTHDEAIAAREVLIAEQRKLNQAIKIMQSDSIPPCAGVTMAIGQYRRRLAAIDDDIREIAEQYQLELQATEAQVEPVEATEAPAEAPVPTAERTQESTGGVAEEPVQVEAPAPAPEVAPAPQAPVLSAQERAVAELLLGLFSSAGVLPTVR